MSLIQDLEQRKASVRQDVHLDASSGHKVRPSAGQGSHVRVWSGLNISAALGASTHQMLSHASVVLVSAVPDERGASSEGERGTRRTDMKT